jgi:hypothetical protein
VNLITSSATLVFLACTISPQADVDHVVTEQVDLVEVNHFYDDQGRHVFDQMIFYDWSSLRNRYQVRAWRLVKSVTQLPQKKWNQEAYVATWQDGEVFREVQARTMRESWTQYDPELAEREFLPKEQRRELTQPRLAKREGK